ncbi:uncharacterized protein RAG0_14404 [Rhynchosporium agropyri]|uniref:Uncharacterized protein n=1 Tax=Rhynchosporium agropyri TaxID=914238 RepID=A0A1E1LGW5_9HELO|nr:uncharacterized protein RAG0_14404 [Rhynchosporium agropyri]
MPRGMNGAVAQDPASLGKCGLTLTLQAVVGLFCPVTAFVSADVRGGRWDGDEDEDEDEDSMGYHYRLQCNAYDNEMSKQLENQ